MSENKTILTGVMVANKITYLHEDMFNGVNLTMEEYLKDGGDIDLYDCDGADTYLIGYKLDQETGLYDVDTEAEYSAIVTETYIQVTYSKYTTLCAPCSPCFPFQNDLETPGDNETYAVPLDLFDNEYSPAPYEVI